MKKAIVFIAFAMLFATSCSSAYMAMREPNVKVVLNSTDYELSEPVQGEAYSVRVLGIDWARLFNYSSGAVATPVLGVNVPLSESYALYDILEKNPGYDFIMYPQITTKSKGVPFIYQTVEIKAVARLGKFTGPAVKSSK